MDNQKQPEYPLPQIEDDKAEVNLSRRAYARQPQGQVRAALQRLPYPARHPLDAYNHRLGNRSALEWVVDRYQATTDSRSGIVNDPNREDDEKYILRLIGQVITVSLETNQIVASLPSLKLGD